MVAQGQNRLPSSLLLAAQKATWMFKAPLLVVGKNAAAAAVRRVTAAAAAVRRVTAAACCTWE